MATASLARTAFRSLFAEQAIQRGHFTLASGASSSYYIDAKAALLHPETLRFLGIVLNDELSCERYDAVGGPELGAVLMTAALLMATSTRPRGLIVRRRAKDHGTQKAFEGRLEAGDRVVVLEDVVTTGESVLKAIDTLTTAGAQIVRVLAICDRLQGAAELLKPYNFKSLYTIADFGLAPENRP